MRGTRPTGRRCAAENALTEIMSHRILLVDDEPDILEFVKYTLVKEGYEVFTAQNGAEALKAAAQHRPHHHDEEHHQHLLHHRSRSRQVLPPS